jgi:prophage regulatory protein
MSTYQQASAPATDRAQAEPKSERFGAQERARILRLRQVAEIVGLGRSSIYRKVQQGTFPSPIKLGDARASGWISTEVYNWIDGQIRRCRKIQSEIR